jgi:hypothetical protein
LDCGAVILESLGELSGQSLALAWGYARVAIKTGEHLGMSFCQNVAESAKVHHDGYESGLLRARATGPRHGGDYPLDGKMDACSCQCGGSGLRWISWPIPQVRVLRSR